MKDLRGKTAIITGAGGGIGLALAEVLAQEGMNLALVDWSAERLAKAENKISPMGAKVSAHQVDVSSSQGVDEAREKILSQHEAVHLLVNGAGITLQKSFAAHSEKDWDDVLGVNLGGAINMTRAFLPDLKAQSDAHILNISSMAGFYGLPTQSSYCASKAALTAFGEALRIELSGEGIGVTTIQPGTIATGLIARNLEQSENQEMAAKIVNGMSMVGMKPDKAARKILRALRRNKPRARIGIDSVLTDWMVRIGPGVLRGPLGIAYRKLLRSEEQGPGR